MTKKEVAKIIKEKKEIELLELEITEQWTSRKILVDGRKNLEIILGRIQSQKKETKEFIDFLNEIIEKN